MIHLIMGGLTLRVSVSSFVATATAMGVAARRLEVDAADQAGAVTRLLC